MSLFDVINGKCAYTEDWFLESLFNYREENSSYCSYIPSPQETTRLVRTSKYIPYLDPTKIRLEEVRLELHLWQSFYEKMFSV